MRKKPTSLFSLLVIFFAFPASAQLYENDQQQIIENGFNAIDLNRDGKYDFTEWWLMYENTLVKKVEEDLSALLVSRDKDSDGSLNLEEYLDNPDSEQEKANFKETDKDGNGKVSIKEIMKFTNKRNAKQGEKYIETIDKNTDGVVTWEEYYAFSVQMLRNQQ